VPTVAVAGRRLRPVDAEALRAAGAARVLDGDASILEVSFALADLLFPAGAPPRRSELAQGGLPVGLDLAAGAPGGRLVGLRRGGAYLLTSSPTPPPGQALTLRLDLGDVAVALRCRVACCAATEGRTGFAVEFALDDPDVAPRLAALTAAPPRAGSRAGRSPSVPSFA
jgi:hypothetical protein